MKIIKVRILIFLIFPLLIVGCSRTSRTTPMEDSLVITIDVDKEPENIHDLDLIKDVNIYSMQSDSILFHDIDKILRYQDKFYLMDKVGSSVIICDTLNNLREITDHGQGPEEYLQLFDITIDPQHQTLNLISRIDQKMLRYNLEGTMLKEVEKLPKAFSNFSKTEWGYVGYMGNYDKDKDIKKVWTLSGKLDLINGFIDMNPSWNSINKGGIHPFSFYKEKVYYTQFLDNGIYAIHETGFSLPYRLDFGSANWPEDKKSYQEYSNVDFGTKMKRIDYIYSFQETENYLIFHFLHNGQNRLGAYDKRINKTYFLYLDVNTEKYFFSFGRIIGMDENAIYALLSASEVETAIAGKSAYDNFEEKYPEQINRLRERFKNLSIDEEDNPFLIVYSIR